MRCSHTSPGSRSRPWNNHNHQYTHKNQITITVSFCFRQPPLYFSDPSPTGSDGFTAKTRGQSSSSLLLWHRHQERSREGESKENYSISGDRKTRLGDQACQSKIEGHREGRGAPKSEKDGKNRGKHNTHLAAHLLYSLISLRDTWVFSTCNYFLSFIVSSSSSQHWSLRKNTLTKKVKIVLHLTLWSMCETNIMGQIKRF